MRLLVRVRLLCAEELREEAAVLVLLLLVVQRRVVAAVLSVVMVWVVLEGLVHVNAVVRAAETSLAVGRAVVLRAAASLRVRWGAVGRVVAEEGLRQAREHRG